MGDFGSIIDILDGKNSDGSSIRVDTDSHNKFKHDNYERRHVKDTVLVIDNHLNFLKEISDKLKKTGYRVESYPIIYDLDLLAVRYSAAIIDIDFGGDILLGPSIYNAISDHHIAKNFVFVTQANPLAFIYHKGGYESHPSYKRVKDFKQYVQNMGDIFLYKNPLFLPAHKQEIPISELVVNLMHDKRFLEKK